MTDNTTNVNIGVQLEVHDANQIERLKKQLDDLKNKLKQSSFAKPIKGAFIDPKILKLADDLEGRVSQVSKAERKRWKEHIAGGKVTQAAYDQTIASVKRLQSQMNKGKPLSEMQVGNLAKAIRQMRLIENAWSQAHGAHLRDMGRELSLQNEIATRMAGLDRRRLVRINREQGLTAKGESLNKALDERRAKSIQRLEDYKIGLRERSHRVAELAAEAEAAGDTDRARRLYGLRDRLRNREVTAQVRQDRLQRQQDAAQARQERRTAEELFRANMGVARYKLRWKREQQREDQRAYDSMRRMADAENANVDRIIRAQSRKSDFMRRMAEEENREFDRSLRHRTRLEREHERERQRLRSEAGRRGRGAVDGVRHATNAVDHPFFSSPLFYMTAAGAAIGATAGDAFSKRMKTQLEEVQLAVFGEYGKYNKELPADQRNPNEVKDMRREWIDAMGIKFGFSPDRALDVVTEGRKAGISKDNIKDFSTLNFQLAHALGADISETAQLLGVSASLLGKKGPEAVDAIKSMGNAIAVAAMESAATSEQMVSGMKRAAGTMAYGMKPEDLTSFVAGGISGGIQSGRAGTLLERTVSITAAAPYQGPQRQKEMKDAFKAMGFGSNLKNVSRQMTQDPAAFMNKALESLSKMDSNKRAQVMDKWVQGEWAGELGQLVKALDVVKRVQKEVKDPNNKDRLKEISDEVRGSLSGMWKSVTASFALMMENFGSGMDGMFRELSTFFIDLGYQADNLRLGEMMRSALQGLVGGFGFDTLTDMIRSIFGTSGRTSDQTLENIGAFFWGLAEGVKTVFKPLIDSFKGVDGKIDYQKMGEYVGMFTSATLVLHAARPFLAVLGGIASLVMGVGSLIGLFMAVGKLTKIARAGGAIGGAGFITKMFSGMFKGLSGNAIAAGFGAFAARSLGFIGRMFSVLFWVWAAKEIVKVFVNNWDTIKPAVANALKAFWSTFTTVFTTLLKEIFMVDEIKAALDAVRQKIHGPDSPEQKAKKANPTQLPIDGLMNKSLGIGQPDPKGFWNWLWGTKPGEIKGGDGNSSIKGGIAYDQLMALDNREVVRQLQLLNQGFTRLTDELTFDGTGGRAGGLNGHLRRPSGGRFHGMSTRPGVNRAGSTFVDSGGNIRPRSPNQHLRRGGGLSGAFSGGMSTGGFGGDPYSSGGTVKTTGGGLSGTGNGSLNPSGALAEAMKFEGMNEYRNTQELAKFMKGRDPRGAANAWCAAFMNAALETQGIKGTGSAVASSFLGWGEQVSDPSQVKAGDILVDHRGRQTGQTGAHVGMATGQTRQGKNGLELEMFSGNSSDSAQKTWEPAHKLAIRRSMAKAIQGAGQEAAKTFEPPANAGALPAGMRNNNPGNLKYSGSAYQRKNFPGMLGPSENTDEGTPQIKFATAMDGLTAMSTLIGKKFEDGRNTVNKMVSAPGGWTPGKQFASENIAKSMGIGANDPINLADPDVKKRFMRALMLQEHGPASKAYSDDQIAKAIQGGSVGQAARQAITPSMPSSFTGPNRTINTPDSLTRDVQPRPGTGPSMPGPQAGGGGNSSPVAIHINGANQNPQELAGLVQRRISEIWSRRTHDLETDIA